MPGRMPANRIGHMSTQVTEDPVAIEQAPTMGLVGKSVSWKALSVIVGQGFWYASLFVLATLVPPRDFGLIAVGSVIVGMTTLVLESGTGGALIIARELDARSVRNAVVRTSAAGIGLTLVFVALAGPIADAFAQGSDPAAFRALAPIVALVAVWVVPNALLMKYLRFKRIAIVTVVAAVAASVAAIVAAGLGAGLWALVIRLVLYQLLLAVLTWVAAASLFPRVRGEHGPPVRREGARAFWAIAAAAVLAWTGDNLVVAASTNTTQLGLYALAFSLAFMPLTQVSWMLGTVLMPAIASARDPEVIRRQALKALRLTALVLMPLLPAAIVLAGGIIPALLGDEWSGMVVPFQILAVVGVGQGIINVLGEVFAGAGGASSKWSLFYCRRFVQLVCYYVVIAYESGGALRTTVIAEDTAAPVAGTASLRVFDAASDAGAIDTVTSPTRRPTSRRCRRRPSPSRRRRCCRRAASCRSRRARTACASPAPATRSTCVSTCRR